MFAKEVMQTRILTIEPEQTLLDAVRLFAGVASIIFPSKTAAAKSSASCLSTT